MWWKSKKNKLDRAELLLIWQTLESRRAHYDALMSQAPALGLTAQAVLMALALEPDYSKTLRLLYAGLALVVALIVIQYFVRNRRNEMMDGYLLEYIEKELGLDVALGVLPSGAPSMRYPKGQDQIVDQRLSQLLPWHPKIWRWNTFRIWTIVQWLFIVTNIVVIFLIIFSSRDWFAQA